MTSRNDMLLDVRRRIANNVRFYRHGLGLSQPEMAKHAGVHENTIYLLENPHRAFNVSLLALISIAHALCLPLGALLVAREDQLNPRGKIAIDFLKNRKNRTAWKEYENRRCAQTDRQP